MTDSQLCLMAQTALSPWVTGIAGMLLAVAIAAFGGFWIARRRYRSLNAHEAQADHVLEMMGAMRSWTHGFAGDVSQFQDKLRLIQEQIDDGKNGAPDGDSLLALIGDVVQAHEGLQQRLDEAEHSLEEKSAEISSYLSEARTDALTTLPNRRAFDDEIARRFSEWQRYGIKVSLILIDIDHFKSFNDTYGHLAGDAVLRHVASVLKTAIRDSDVVARFGGEEFAVILPSSDALDSRPAALRIVSHIAQGKCLHEGIEHRVTASCGLAEAVEKDSVTTLIKRADAALYAAKDAGRNRAFFDNGNDPQAISLNSSPLVDDPDVPDRFLQVCDDLRERLIEMTQSCEGGTK